MFCGVSPLTPTHFATSNMNYTMVFYFLVFQVKILKIIYLEKWLNSKKMGKALIFDILYPGIDPIKSQNFKESKFSQDLF